jgi:aryl-alcohol dehydrogenase-like predicted oxidoreductase
MKLSTLRSSGPPRVVLGTMNFGERTKEPEATSVIRRARELGVECFDTANIYCSGESERILGRALALKDSANRAAVEIATKVGAWKREGLAPERVVASLDESLGRLGTDHVDVYYLHVPDVRVPIGETLSALKDVLASGKAKAWGVSNYASWQILEMLQIASRIGLDPPACAQHLYNCLHRELEIEYFAFRSAHPIHLTVYNALAGGLLTGRHGYGSATGAAPKAEKGSRLETNPLYVRRYVSGPMFSRAGDVARIAEEHGVPIVDLAYAFLGTRKLVDSVLVGPATVAQLEAAIDGVARELPKACVDALDALERSWTGTDTHYARLPALRDL